MNDLKELKYTFLHKSDRQKYAALIASGVPKNRILDDHLKESNSLLDDSPKTNTVTTDLLSNTELLNIEGSYNVKSHENFAKPFKCDSQNVEVFVKQYEHSILLFKREGEACPEIFSDCEIKDTDLILIFMCPTQEAALQKHGNHIICMDETHGMNPYKYLLHTMLVARVRLRWRRNCSRFLIK